MMVRKYDKYGTPYLEPPYTKEELREIERTLYDPPVTVVRGPRPESRPPGQEEQRPAKLRPASKRPRADQAIPGPRR
jgi:hypothetical protein